MSSKLNVLILEDHPDDAELVLLELEQANYAVEWVRVDNEKDYLAHLNPEFQPVVNA